MKNTALLVVGLLFFLIASCSSSPPPATVVPEQPAPSEQAPPPQPSGPSQASLDALNQAAARAEAARKRASDFESPAYFPSDWETVEAQYAAAGVLPKSSDTELDQAAAAFNAAADAYDDLFGKTIPLYAQAREDEIITARDELIATGVTADYPEYLRAVDETAIAAQGRYEAEDYYAARDTAAKSLGAYQTLKTAAGAYLVRQEIVNRNFESYDPENFGKADEIGMDAVNAYNSGDQAAAKDKAEEALLRYNLVLSAGWAGYAADQSAAAAAARQAALDARADVAAKSIFAAGDMSYNQAGAAMKSEQYESAASLYDQSAAHFTVAARTANEKRRIADEALQAAGNKIKESDEAARQAETIIEGGSI